MKINQIKQILEKYPDDAIIAITKDGKTSLKVALNGFGPSHLDHTVPCLYFYDAYRSINGPCTLREVRDSLFALTADAFNCSGEEYYFDERDELQIAESSTDSNAYKIQSVEFNECNAHDDKILFNLSN